MHLALTIGKIIAEVLGGIVLVAAWAYGLYLRGGYKDRIPKSGVQTLFTEEK